MFNYFRGLIPETLQSGSPDCPLPLDVYNVFIDKLLALDEKWYADIWDSQDVVCFKANGFKPCIEIRMRKGAIRVDLSFPSKDDPYVLLKNKEIEISERWVFKKERWIFKRSDMKRHFYFYAQKYEKESLAVFLDSLFRKLYGCPEGYVIQGKLSLGTWQND